MTREVPERHPALTVGALLEHTESFGTLAELLGVTRRTLHRYARTGLTIHQADRFAAVLGMHPAQLWPAWLDIDATRKRRQEADRIARLRSTNPAYADRNRQYALTYWREHRDALKAVRRARYARNAEREKAAARAYRRRRRLAGRTA